MGITITRRTTIPQAVMLENSFEWVSNHFPEDCPSRQTVSRKDPLPCPLHFRTAHHMRTWQQVWRADKCVFERTCQHGIGHPDPDDAVGHRVVGTVHGCDGCCRIGSWPPG